MSRVGAALPDDPSAQLRAVAERLSTLPDPMLTPFQRGKSARSKSGKSIGLGLYIARTERLSSSACRALGQRNR